MKQLKSDGGAPAGAPAAKQEGPKPNARALELAAQARAVKRGDYYCIYCGLPKGECHEGPYEWSDD